MGWPSLACSKSNCFAAPSRCVCSAETAASILVWRGSFDFSPAFISFLDFFRPPACAAFLEPFPKAPDPTSTPAKNAVALGCPEAVVPGCTSVEYPALALAFGDDDAVILFTKSSSTSRWPTPFSSNQTPPFAMSCPNRAASRHVAICPPAKRSRVPPTRSPPFPPKKSETPNGRVKCFFAHSFGLPPVAVATTSESTSRSSPKLSWCHTVPALASPTPVVSERTCRAVTNAHSFPHRSSGWRFSASGSTVAVSPLSVVPALAHSLTAGAPMP